VYVLSNGSFTMTGGTISGNGAGHGGGVRIYKDTATEHPSFTKTGGIIYGNDAANPADRNVAFNSSGTLYRNGDAVCYYDGSLNFFRDTTLYANDNISTTNIPPSMFIGGDTNGIWTVRAN